MKRFIRRTIFKLCFAFLIIFLFASIYASTTGIASNAGDLLHMDFRDIVNDFITNLPKYLNTWDAWVKSHIAPIINNFTS